MEDNPCKRQKIEELIEEINKKRKPEVHPDGEQEAKRQEVWRLTAPDKEPICMDIGLGNLELENAIKTAMNNPQQMYIFNLSCGCYHLSRTYEEVTNVQIWRKESDTPCYIIVNDIYAMCTPLKTYPTKYEWTRYDLREKLE